MSLATGQHAATLLTADRSIHGIRPHLVTLEVVFDNPRTRTSSIIPLFSEVAVLTYYRRRVKT